MLAPSSRTTSNVSLGTGTTKFILLLSAIRIVGQRVTHGWRFACPRDHLYYCGRQS
jgi:hypothetical protein